MSEVPISTPHPSRKEANEELLTKVVELFMDDGPAHLASINMRALIADDDRGTAAILAKALKRWSRHLIVAHDGNTAWAALRSDRPPSLAIIDWMMPGIDGLELCRRIRRDPTLAGMYLILLTGRDSRADLIVGLDAGADDYIVKPFDREELRARVQVGIRVVRLQEHLAARVTELQATRDELVRLASTDVLTGLCSRRRWLEVATAEFGRYQRYNRPLALLMADVDFFKRVNDTFGHDVGDDALRQFASVLSLQCRATDVAGRLGGEEFGVLLPETSVQAAQEVARRIVESCRSVAVLTPKGDVHVSCSIGVTEAVRGDGGFDALIRRADEAMYEAKRAGRDRWKSTVHPSEKLTGVTE